ncbi:MAG: arsenate reductase (glutaredoxin) [Gammaproteobacteria bacterium]|nr:MAG: arsenate reductase (glutaredoxin) [Gammaproteobacteria bacterium]
MQVTVYHNPRCSKSRETVKLLEENHIDFTTRLYLQDVPGQAEIKELVKLLGFSSVRELMRIKESTYKALNLKEEKDDNKLIEAMVKNPQLIERPIVVVDNQAAVIGRPPASVLALFE